MPPRDNDELSEVRIDKWLWAARFFRTRSMAVDAIRKGRVELNGTRPKPSRTLRTGDALRIERGDERFEVEVLALSDQRGNATVAATLYRESDASRAAREEQRAGRRAAALSAPRFEGRPDKRGRRALRELKSRN